MYKADLIRRWALVAALAALLSACLPAADALPQGVRAVYTAEGGLWVWEPTSGATRLMGRTTLDRVRMSPDGRWIAAAAEEGVIVIDTYGPSRRVLLSRADIARLDANAVWFRWVPGQPGWLAYWPIQPVRSVSYDPAALRIVDVTTNTHWDVVQAERPSLRFSPEGQYVSVKTTQGIDVVALADGAPIAEGLLTAEDDLRLAVQWSPDSGGLLTVGPQVYRGSFLSRTMTVTHVGLDGVTTPVATVESRPAQLSLSPDGAYAAAIADKWLTITTLGSGEVVTRFRTDIESRLRPQWSPDSRAVLYYDEAHVATVGWVTGEHTPLTDAPLQGEATILLEWLDDQHVYLLRSGHQAGDPERLRYWHYVARVGGEALLIVEGRPSNVNVIALGVTP